ncbi:LysR family transcriptional regulator [Anaeromicropila herbilytica]|uniref:LysR family transcriptional regulator n=1 Tax=Anaeromicropila herbilytica TaxID=2785025 RepID=A0A7R7EN64_9FIRM|nr:LysR family transcriptional regulator [Anaeromicropila herbilytica]BCN32035.1 LysR family transcriptional regulator [Anaeromicropila herbilytica]
MEQNLSLYKIFYTVAKTGNISHAAKELYISQPAISKSISKLEDNLKVTLFIRNSRGVHLTEEGQLLYEHVKQAFDSITIGEESIKKITSLGIGQIRIGVSTTLCKYILLPYLKEFVEAYPHIKITIHCQSTFHTIKMLENNQIDIGLIGKPSNEKNITFHPVMEIEDIFVATKQYLKNLELREEHSSESIDDLVQVKGEPYPLKEAEIFKKANLMLLDEENITRVYINEYFNTHQIETNQILEINTMELLIEFAKIGLGVACVIKEFVLEDLISDRITEIPLSTPIGKRAVGFAYSRSTYLSPSMRSFIDYFKINQIASEE